MRSPSIHIAFRNRLTLGLLLRLTILTFASISVHNEELSTEFGLAWTPYAQRKQKPETSMADDDSGFASTPNAEIEGTQ